MTEQATPEALTDIEELRNNALVAHNIREAIENIGPTDASSLAACEVAYLRAHPEDLSNQRRYAEVHILNDSKPVVLISPFAPYERQNAIVGGYHSLIDEVNVSSGDTQAWCKKVFNQTELAHAGTETLAAKGYLLRTEDTTMQLEIQVHHGQNGRAAGIWLSELLKEASALGLDGGITMNPLGGSTNGAAEHIEIDRHYASSLIVTPFRDVPETLHAPYLLQGIVTNIQAQEARFSNPYHGKVDQITPLEISSLVANSRIHNSLYEQAGIADPKGLLDVSIDGHAVRMGVHYTLDFGPEEPQSSISIFYDKDYGAITSELEHTVISAIRDEIRSPQSESPLRVTISVGDNPPRMHHYAHAWVEQ